MPAPTEHRIASLDLLRGVACLGILLVNVASFAMPDIAHWNPVSYRGELWHDRWVHAVVFVVADQKFLSVFSMLFGAGIWLQFYRTDGKEIRIGTHLRRCAWLLVFGIAHVVFLWQGDILVTYALCGIFLVRLSKWSARSLLWAALILLLVPVARGIYVSAQPSEISASWLQKIEEVWKPSQEEIKNDIGLHLGKKYRRQVTARIAPLLPPDVNQLLAEAQPAPANREPHALMTLATWRPLAVDSTLRALGMMLLGMTLVQPGYFGREQPPSSTLRRFAIASASIGLSVTLWALAIDIQANWSSIIVIYKGGALKHIGSVSLALSYSAAIVLWARSSQLTGPQRWLRAVGRMSLTNYLAQSLVASFVFYGWGLALYGNVSRFQQMQIVVLLCLLQCVWSTWWLARFRLGPAEWLWRSLTTWSVLPLKAVQNN